MGVRGRPRMGIHLIIEYIMTVSEVGMDVGFYADNLRVAEAS